MAAPKFAYPQGETPVIDVHYHYFAPQILGPLGELVVASPEETEAAMAKLGTTTVIYSLSLWSKYTMEWSAEKWSDVCRQVTDAQAAEVAAKPAHRGSFAPLPLPHVKETFAALKYCEEELQPRPEGYAITTYAGNEYLGHPQFIPIWEECNRRGVVLFVHPSDTFMPNLDQKTYPFPMIEFPTETARCIMNLLATGVFTKYPNIKWIFSHNGGSFPYLYQRVDRLLSGTKLWAASGPGAKPVNSIADNNDGKTLEQVFGGSNVYWECSQGTPEQQLPLRAMGVKPQNILMGTDWPYTGKEDVKLTLGELHGPERSGFYSKEEVKDIRAGNALALMPRLAKAWIKAGLAVQA